MIWQQYVVLYNNLKQVPTLQNISHTGSRKETGFYYICIYSLYKTGIKWLLRSSCLT